jgi:formylglycine-generating enzyme required for sulfatase activity
MFSVTQGEWEKIMGKNPSFFPYGPNFPVENVSWNAVQHFIDKLSTKSNREFCLPTEAEWEYAARSGGKRQKYAGGDDVDRVAWYMVNSGRHPHEVGTKAPNGLEIYDMSGNVDEWCRDIYDLDAYSRHSRNNPVIPSGGSGHVYRGGSWHNGPRRVRTSFRDHEGPEFTNYDLGFRLCLPQSGSK